MPENVLADRHHRGRHDRGCWRRICLQKRHAGRGDLAGRAGADGLLPVLVCHGRPDAADGVGRQPGQHRPVGGQLLRHLGAGQRDAGQCDAELRRRYYDSLTTGTGNDSGNTLTLGSGFTVDVSGGIDYLGVQDWAYYYVGDLGDTLDNAGQINISGGSLTVDYGTFNNTGTLNVTGGVLAIGGAFSNSGSIIVGAGGTLDLQGTETTAQLGGMTFDGGTLEIGGVLDNTGATLDVGTGTAQGSLLLSGGTIEGGTIEAAGGGFASRNGTLDGVTWQGVLALTALTSPCLSRTA